MENSWQNILTPPGNENEVWDLFHENSKRRRSDQFLSEEELAARMAAFSAHLPVVGAQAMKLPPKLPLNMSLGAAIATRRTCHALENAPLSTDQLGTLLQNAYGVSRESTKNDMRRFRVVSSAGALYPLEIFFHTVSGADLEAGLYYYEAGSSQLRYLRQGDATSQISQAVVQADIPMKASVVFFLTAVFERTIFKYGDRGYRFVLLEAGHVAQNINLVATALGLGCVNIGGFFDREIDDFLDLDGITHSTVYMIAVGHRTTESDTSMNGGADT